MDTVSESRLARLHPVLADRLRQMEAALVTEGIYVRVVQGERTFVEQAALYAQGRTSPGSIVTNAPPGHGWHEYRMAADCCPSTHGPGMPFDPDWHREHPTWKKMQEVGESLGLYSGVHFRSIPDSPHFQLTKDGLVSPTDDVRAAYEGAGGGDDGVEAVWRLTGFGM